MTIMAYVDKARVEGTLYDISPSPTGNLDSTSDNAYTSSDVAQANATTWTNVDPILNTEQHRSIFSKLTSMIKNIRYLYNVVGSGTFAPGNGTTITDVVNNKAPKSHTHTAAQLPTSNSQINSTSYVPTSALIYSMNQTLNSLNDALQEVENGIPSVNPVLNNRFVQSPIYTISSISDADNFCNMYNHDNNYGLLQLGQTITINDGTYNKDWYVAGFDCEYNHKAADGTTKNSGYGICLIPTKNLTNSVWHSVNSVAYMNSTIHTLCNGTIANNLKKVLGSHLINRNVLLGSSANTSQTTGYTWTKSYVTLMSQYQLMGGSLLDDENENIYDRGEANYKLPLFKYFPFEIPVLLEGNYSDYYLRTLLAVDTLQRPKALRTVSGHSIDGQPCLYSSGVRPLIYIR